MSTRKCELVDLFAKRERERTAKGEMKYNNPGPDMLRSPSHPLPLSVTPSAHPQRCDLRSISSTFYRQL